jgi:hypothetical protein
LSTWIGIYVIAAEVLLAVSLAAPPQRLRSTVTT